MSAAPTDAPPWLAWRNLLDRAIRENDQSVRGLARELQRERPRSGGDDKGAESWRNTLTRYLARSEDRHQFADDETARLLARVLGKPADYFVTPSRGGGSLREENARLRAEIAELHRRLEAGESDAGRG